MPSWSTTPPNYPGLLKMTNCPSDSLAENKPLWSTENSTRCIVAALGFYEWLHKGKGEILHFVKRKDGEMMLFAGLWDCAQYEGMQMICLGVTERAVLRLMDRKSRKVIYRHNHHHHRTPRANIVLARAQASYTRAMSAYFPPHLACIAN